MVKVLQILDENGSSVGEVDFNKEKFDEVKLPNLKMVLNMYEANKRQGTASTKTRSEVQGSGRKPWAQKHLGRARAGSIRSPLWRGGGVVFGPKPRDYSRVIPKKMRKVALNSAITSKLNNNEVKIIDKFIFEKPSTRKIVELLKKLDINSSCLIVINEYNDLVLKSARNVKSLTVRVVSDLNALDVLNRNVMLITQNAMDVLNTN